MNMLSPGPLTDEEIEELDQFLLEAEGLEESMDISTLDGFLTAIVCGPKTIMPSEWLRWVWDMESGKDAPEFKDQAQAQRILGLLMRHMNDIAETLQQAPEHYEPLLMENPNGGDPIPIIDEWCSGFMKGVQLDSDGWLPVVIGKPDWMSTITLYGTEDGWEALKKKNLSLDEHKALAAGLAGTVQKIHALWLEQRRKQIAAALCQTSCAVSRFEIRPRSAATSPVPADLARSSNSVTEAPTGCTEPRGKFQRSAGRYLLVALPMLPLVHKPWSPRLERPYPWSGSMGEGWAHFRNWAVGILTTRISSVSWDFAPVPSRGTGFWGGTGRDGG